MKNIRIYLVTSVLILGMISISCENYLDKAPESIITEKDAFVNFRSFQGFVEEMYNCIVDYNNAYSGNYSLADETLNTTPFNFDLGNYWSQNFNAPLFYGDYASFSTAMNPRSKRIWQCSWYAIRKANVALEKLKLMTDATQEEKDLIKGQALFFRGFYYFDLMRYWGGLPYVDRVLSPTEDMKLPRLNYRETALKAAKDLEDAAALLPVNWDDTQAGKPTLGNNRKRISKVMALGFLGKDLLYAASPMMNEESTGKNSFDAELCKRAAKAFADAIKICDETGMFKMQPWATWTDNFWVWSPSNRLMPGGTEAIMNVTVYDYTKIRWSTVGVTCPVQFAGNNTTVEVPTHNFVKNYAMANGLPITDPASGYNPNDPWTGREPRFYSDIIYDGVEMHGSSTAASLPDKFALLYTGGRHRTGSVCSTTGYFYKRYSPKGCNQWENLWANFQAYVPYLRVADLYMMYCESVLQGYGSASSIVPGFSLTAEQAINIVRNRAQLPNINSKYTATKDAFMEEIIRERAVEFAFEAHRFCDLRRWNLAGETKYKEKTAIDFDRDPVTQKPKNLKERVVVTRVFEKKHNWLPFQTAFTKLYPEFPQNPGW